ncbi:MAG: hypothetical protein DRJ03_02020 [Chloroflexi bacterium]|nr:MAG: hypothetical protein DRJ03_02020 [Chloroflexota bacterium]
MTGNSKLYELVDTPTKEELERCGLRGRSALFLKRYLRAKLTGEFRPPRKGEWFLSGAIPEAYRAPNDLDGAYHIARFVRVRAVPARVEECSC